MLPHDRRSAKRLESGHLVVHSESDQDPVAACLGMGVTLDINEFGLRLQSTERFELGGRFRFNIALQDQVVSALGRVVHVAETLNGTYETGVEFLEVSSEDVERIRRYMNSRTGS